MALETGTYISDLVSTNPAGTDTLDKADDHLRLIKSTVKATFPNITGAVTPTHTELNFVDGVTSAIQTQLDAKSVNSIASVHTALQIELGHASDTTLARVSAGVAAIEGKNIALNGTTEVLTTGTIELGAASDTTISRSAAGVIAVEGGIIPKENRANTFTETQTISGDAKLLQVRAASPTSFVSVDAQADDYASGPTFTATSIVQYGSTATGTTAGLPRAGLGIMSFQNGSAGLLGTNGAKPLVFMTQSLERLRIESGGNVLVTGVGGLGYGTGSGGAVTQITSRTTGVTINKTNGAVTLFTAAGSTTATTLTVTNSTVAATDTVVVSVKSGTNVYLAYVTAVAAGSFNITFQTTGGTASDAPVFNFAVIKAVTS